MINTPLKLHQSERTWRQGRQWKHKKFINNECSSNVKTTRSWYNEIASFSELPLYIQILLQFQWKWTRFGKNYLKCTDIKKSLLWRADLPKAWISVIYWLHTVPVCIHAIFTISWLSRAYWIPLCTKFSCHTSLAALWQGSTYCFLSSTI